MFYYGLYSLRTVFYTYITNVEDRSNGKCVKTKHVCIKRGGKALGDSGVVTLAEWKKICEEWEKRERPQAQIRAAGWGEKVKGRLEVKGDRGSESVVWESVKREHKATHSETKKWPLSLLWFQRKGETVERKEHQTRLREGASYQKDIF